ncbi:MAG TPA: FtsX-like permease family protein, partial [Capillimicrobium sp.]
MRRDSAWSAAGFALAVRLAWRDLRGGFSGFRVFLACIALGVAAIVGVGSTARGLGDSVSREGRRILGGDASFALIHREATEAERGWMQRQGKVSSVAAMRAMARRADGASALVELKAVDEAYPPLGDLVTRPSLPLADWSALRDGAWGFLAEEALAVRLDIKPSDRVMIGNGTFELRAILVSEPDKLASGVGFGPRAMISQAALRETGLVQPGSLVRWIYRVTLPDVGGREVEEPDVEALIGRADAAFPQAGWQTRSRTNVSPQFTRNVERFSQFLTLVALTALIVGGVGVANAVRAYVDRKRADLATLKSLGATGGYVFTAALVQVAFVALVGIAGGLAVGAALPFVVASAVGSLLPVPFEPTVYPSEVAAGALYGALTTLAFSMAPLGRAHDVPVASLYRNDAGAGAALRPRYLALTAAAVAALLAAVYLLSYERRLTLIYVAATFGGFLLLRGVGAVLIWAARRAPRTNWTELRLALSNVHRPGAITQSVVLSLGLGLALLVALTMIDVNLRTQIQQGLPGKTPSFFFIDIPNREAEAFDRFVKTHAPQATLERV